MTVAIKDYIRKEQWLNESINLMVEPEKRVLRRRSPTAMLYLWKHLLPN